MMAMMILCLFTRRTENSVSKPIQCKDPSKFKHCKTSVTSENLEEIIDAGSKPRTALFQGGEDDEPMAPQNISMEYSSSTLNMFQERRK